MKTVMITLFAFAVSASTALAQEGKRESYPYWTISKAVVQQQFKKSVYVPSEMRTTSSNWFNAKGIHTRKNETVQTSRVATTGYPTWTISKGVARQQAERASQK